MQEFIIDKHRYMKYLKSKGYEIAPTSFINLEKWTPSSFILLTFYLLKNVWKIAYAV